MAALDDLLARVSDPALRADLEREIAPLRGEQELGLVFERHLPESVRLLGHPVRRGLTVTDRASDDETLWRVGRVKDGVAQLHRRADDGSVVEESRPVEELVVVREFGEPIYPGLKSVGRVERGGDKPWHVAINAENYHALETLLYTCEGQVDAIYIDPPYNTGARDWKYNNDYVDGQDRNRHSKWLSFMEKRLLLAKRLLNPDDSVLIVTIDEKEYLRLGMLLGQMFQEANIQMVTSSIKPSGSQRADEFSRVEEFIFFVMLGGSHPGTSTTDMLRDSDGEVTLATVTWQGLRRRGSTDWKRSHRPNGFYPLFISNDDGSLHSVGEPIPLVQDRQTVKAPSGTWAAWPLDPKGEEGRWQVSPLRLREQLAEGTAALRKADPSSRSASVVYLKGGDLAAVRSGSFQIDGRDAEGKLNVLATAIATRKAKTMWLMPSHDASAHGTALLSRFLPDRKFPFPKSLYAVEDALRFFVKDKPDALIIDFFGGSGTTAHAVARLNKQDGGRRRSIIVSNNEVSPEEAKKLREDGHLPGDPEWETVGIFEYITRPRIEAAITGLTPDGDKVKGDYKFTDEFPMADGFDENVEFFNLTYEDADRVRLGAAFEAVAPLLWLRAGAVGPRIDGICAEGWALPEGGRYGVLFTPDAMPPFLKAVRESETVTMVFVVTDSDAVFQQVTAELPASVEPVRLYESYLSSFAINTGGAA